MATVTTTAITNAGSTVTYAATTVGGDEVTPNPNGDTIIEFLNGHNASITINVVPTLTPVLVDGVGYVTTPTRSLALAAGAHGRFKFTKATVAAYLNANGRIPITYASGNTALTILALAA